jgi:hypothetical protein
MRKRIDPASFDSEMKESYHLKEYERCFEHLVDREIRLLELGVYRGKSLLLWRDYFEKGRIVGLDCSPVTIDDPTGRIHLHAGYQQDTALLDRIARQEAPDGFDVIIDDCSHIAEFTRTSFWYLFVNHLKPGAIYAIEDINTGFMEDRVDGGRYKMPPIAARSSPVRGADQHHVRGQVGISLVQSWARFGKTHMPESIVNSLLRSRRFGGLYERLHKLTHSGRRKRRIPSHMYGMIGFAKELIDVCARGDTVNGARIERIEVSRNHLIIIKSRSDSDSEMQRQVMTST